jgi:hypothetical protein
VAGQLKNVFWVGANIIADTATGETKQVLMLVYREEDASAFTRQDADKYLNFFSARVSRITQISWTIQTSRTRPGFFVIQGEQYV